MSIDKTRQLGIEFERRVQTMIPETEVLAKLDTETIYSFLNQYQDKFIHDIYKALDQIQSPSKPSAYVETILSGLLTMATPNITAGEDNSYTIVLPKDFGLYIDSYTKVSDSYSYKLDDERKSPGYIPNTLVSQSQINGFRTRPQDSMRIMRQPIASLSKDHNGNNIIEVLYDRYTTPAGFKMSYYKVPNYMNLMTSTPCELPDDAFDDLVTGAVDLYVQYVAGAEARKRQQQEAQQRRNNKEDEQ